MASVPDIIGEVQCEEVCDAAVDWEDLFGLAPTCLDTHSIEREPWGPEEPRLPFCEWLSVQAAYYRSLATPAAEWLAALIQEHSDLARSTHSLTPADLDARTEVLESGRDATIRRGGYDTAMRQVMGTAWRPADVFCSR